MQISFFVYTLCMHGGPFIQISLLNSHILYGGTLRLVSSHTIRARARIRPSDRFLCILHGGPRSSCNKFICLLYGGPAQDSLFVYYGGGGGAQDQFLLILYAPAPPSDPSDQFLHLLYGGPQVNFFVYYMGPH